MIANIRQVSYLRAVLKPGSLIVDSDGDAYRYRHDGTLYVERVAPADERGPIPAEHGVMNAGDDLPPQALEWVAFPVAVYELGEEVPGEALRRPLDIDPALNATLRRAGDLWGALGVALAAAHLTDVPTLISQLMHEQDGTVTEPVPTEAAQSWVEGATINRNELVRGMIVLDEEGDVMVWDPDPDPHRPARVLAGEGLLAGHRFLAETLGYPVALLGWLPGTDPACQPGECSQPAETESTAALPAFDVSLIEKVIKRIDDVETDATRAVRELRSNFRELRSSIVAEAGELVELSTDDLSGTRTFTAYDGGASATLSLSGVDRLTTMGMAGLASEVSGAAAGLLRELAARRGERKADS